MKIAIVGGSGKMGQWFARFFRADGHEVLITGRNQARLDEVRHELDVAVSTDLAEVRHCHLIVISVPPDAFEPMVLRLAPHTNEEQAILDVTSLKTAPVAAMQRHIKAGRILGTHPVFGPGARDMAGRNFVLTPTNDAEAALAGRVREYLEGKGARVSLMTPEEHDEVMTVVLGLAHFIAIVSAETLLGSERFGQMKEIGGTTYQLLRTLVESVVSEDPELYASLQMSFPGMAEAEGRFLSNAEAWAGLVRDGDRDGFAARLAALKGKLARVDPDFQKAYEDMYRLTDGPQT
jgi:prephenate dehydrogenase